MNSDHSTHVLIVEDEIASLNLLASYLEKEAYVVFKAESGERALEILHSTSIQIALIDINLPGKDGLTLTRELRAHSKIGIILVTSKKGDIDRIVGLELGADDYITKPYNPRELLVRLRNLVQRISEVPVAQRGNLGKQNSVVFDGWTLNSGRRLLTSNAGESIQLTEGEFKLLSALIENSGHVLTRDTLMNLMEGRDWTPSDRTIDVLVARLRKKLDDDRELPKYISTAHGTGYVFVADVHYLT